MLAFSQTAAEVQEPSAEPTSLPYRRPSRAEAEAAVRTLIGWAGAGGAGL